jgi:hypothetical protein
MGELACSRFCSNIREYAYTLGKRSFFLFGEVATPSDDVYNRYIGQNTSRQDSNKGSPDAIRAVAEMCEPGPVS